MGHEEGGFLSQRGGQVPLTKRFSIEIGSLQLRLISKRGVKKSKMKRSAILVATILISLCLVPVSLAVSSTQWVSETSVFDITGNSTLQPTDPLIAGHAYNITMQVTVPFNGSSRFYPALNGLMQQVGSQFWYVKTPGYHGYNSSTFMPGSRFLNFTQVQGTLTLSSVFKIPVNITLTKVGNVTLHLTQKTFPVITVTLKGGTPPVVAPVGNLTANIEDQTIQTYLQTYQAKSTLISSGMIDATYSTEVNGILTESQTLYALGLPDQGTALLQTLTPSNFPAPPNTSLMNYLFIAVGVAVVVIILLAVFTLRGRGKQGYASGLVNEAQKELAVLEVTAAKYDKALADRLKSVREKLGETD
jgi:hypothetical protein